MRGLFGKCVWGVMAMVFISVCAVADDYPFNSEKIGKNVLMLTTRTGNSTIMAVAGDKGILVADSMWSPNIAMQARKRIAREFGRSDFKYLVLTNLSDLSCGGASAFSDCELICHIDAKKALEDYLQIKERSLQRRAREFQQRVTRSQGQLKDVESGSERARGLKDWIELCEIIAVDMEKGYELPLPTKTISAEEQIDLGSIKVILRPFGKATSGGDLMVLVPGAKTVFLGDIFHAQHVMPLPDQGVKVEPDKWLVALKSVSHNEYFIRANGVGIWEGDTLQRRITFLQGILDFAKKAEKEGKDMKQLLEVCQDPAAAFPFLSAWPEFQNNQELLKYDLRNTLSAIWKQNHKSAADELFQILEKDGANKAKARYEAIKNSKSKEYYFAENELNSLGYRLLQTGKPGEAIALFRINTQENPDSWNTWDSLGEALLWAEMYLDSQKAYQRSLELNPESASGKAALKRIEGALWDIEHETKIAPKYRPGEQTGLKGPYLGQKLPGLEPELFAPGIVSTSAGKEFSGCFSPDGKEFYFNREGKIMVSYLEKEGWTAPREAPFNSDHFDHEAHITADNKTMYFGSGRPRQGGNYGIYRMKRTAQGWSEPEFLFDGMYVTTTATGDLYLTDFQRNGTSKFFIKDGKVVKAVKQLGGVNEPATAAHACVAKDESFIVFDSTRPGGQGGEGDYYISFKQPDGSWGPGINLGEKFNTIGASICPFLSPDEKFLFFYKERDLYWVSTEVFKKLKK
jgi:glyoxylase-like metal-dependent hydrolase (beta-lactamase superfamily II)